jgi:serine/threonine-protein kinase
MGSLLGQTLDGKYRIVRSLGEGGMGTVYEGEHVLIRRRVAIKVLHAELAANLQIVARFEREAQVAGRVGNDHILEILDLGRLPGGDRYMVMEYLDGETLGDRLARVRRISPGELLPLVDQVLDGLAAAHDAGIVHRDLKPDNVFILPAKPGRSEFVKIIDFGISKFRDTGQGMGLTAAGTLMGTPYYMSPEQASGAPVDHRADLYAMGVILFECLSGTVPFRAQTFNELIFEIVMSETPPLSVRCRNIDPALEAIVRKAMAREVTDRFQSARELAEALRGRQQTQEHAPTLVSAVGTPSAPPAAAERLTPPTNRPPPPVAVDKTLASWESSRYPRIRQSPRWIAVLSVASVALLGGGVLGVYRLLGSGQGIGASGSSGLPTVPGGGSSDGLAPARTKQVSQPARAQWHADGGTNHRGAGSEPLVVPVDAPLVEPTPVVASATSPPKPVRVVAPRPAAARPKPLRPSVAEPPPPPERPATPAEAAPPPPKKSWDFGY